MSKRQNKSGEVMLATLIASVIRVSHECRRRMNTERARDLVVRLLRRADSLILTVTDRNDHFRKCLTLAHRSWLAVERRVVQTRGGTFKAVS